MLLECPGVENLFCFGVPHKELGETVGVVLVEKKGVSVSLKQLNKYGLQSGKLAVQWLPSVIVFSDSIPKVGLHTVLTLRFTYFCLVDEIYFLLTL